MPDSEALREHHRPVLLRGNEIGLAMMRKDDIPTIAAWHQDLEFTAFLGTPGEAHTVELRQELFDRNSKMKDDSVEFAIVLLSTGDLIGFGGLFDITRAMTAKMFVGIGEKKHQSKGYGTEASRLICEYGFFFLSLFSIVVEVNGFNLRAVRMYERIGFRPAGRIRGAILLNARRYDQIFMDLIRDEFPLARELLVMAALRREVFGCENSAYGQSYAQRVREA